MPRISAEARSASAFRAGGKMPAPPPKLRGEARELWKDLMREKPLGYFDKGNHRGLLGQYCWAVCKVEKLQALADELDEMDPRSEALEARIVRLNGNITTYATKLRLTVQNLIDRKSRILLEGGSAVDNHEEEASDALLGNNVWQQPNVGLRN